MKRSNNGMWSAVKTRPRWQSTAQHVFHVVVVFGLWIAAVQSVHAQSPTSLDGKKLTREAFVREVLARNPTLEAAQHGWRAAVAEVSQAYASSTLQLDYALAPLSISKGGAPFGQVVRMTHRSAWPGQRSAEQAVAKAEASSKQHDFEATRHQLALVASLMFDDYVAASEALDVAKKHVELAELIKSAVQARYEAGRATQVDAIEADVEFTHAVHMRVVAASAIKIQRAKMNGLMHQSPDSPLALPDANDAAAPTETEIETVQPSATLVDEAWLERPDLVALRDQVRRQESRVSLVQREYSPKVGVMGEYNTMWASTDHRWMLGASLSVPVQPGSRRAARNEAEARVSQAKSLLSGAMDAVAVEVVIAREQWVEALHVHRLYRTQLVPLARARFDAARASYEAGQGAFSSLIDAWRSLLQIELEAVEASATAMQRAAELSFAVGHAPVVSGSGYVNGVGHVLEHVSEQGEAQ